jgi:hypothetical protein
MRRQAGRRPTSQCENSDFILWAYIYTYRNNDHKVFYDPVPTHDLSGMNSLNTSLKKYLDFTKREKRSEDMRDGKNQN